MLFRRRLVLLCSAVFLILIAGREVATQGTTAGAQSGQAAAKPPAQSPAPAKIPPIPAAAANPQTGWEERVMKVPVVGQATVYVPRHPQTSNVILFISGDGGWNLGVVDIARRMMPKAIVAGISYVGLRKNGVGPNCWMPSGDIEIIAKDVQRQLQLPNYQQPALVGYSSGATMVYEALAASPYSFAGGLALGFCPDLPASHSLCASDTFKPPARDVKMNVVMLPKVKSLTREFYVVNGVQDAVCDPAATHQFLDDIGNVHFYEAPGTGHGFSRPQRWGPEFDEAFEKLMASAEAVNHPKRTAAVPAPAGSAATLEPKLEGLGLPLVYQWASRTKALMIFVSGDGGWASIDSHLADYLVAHDVSVVGLNAQSYFWNERTPEQSGADLARIVDTVTTLQAPVFVGGYSLGAEVVPFMLNAWKDADRSKVHGAVLIAPSETATFEFKVVNMVFRAKKTPYVVADAVKASHVPTFCLSGAAEEKRDTACDDMASFADAVTLPGSHHFNSKYDEVGRVVLEFLDKHLR
jgi:type IV secretory pathway VirJ component